MSERDPDALTFDDLTDEEKARHLAACVPSPDSARIERLLRLGDAMADELAVWTNNGLQMCHCCNHKSPINETIRHDSMCPVAAWIAGRDE